VRVPAGVDRGTRGTHGGTERIGEALDDREVLGAVDATAAGDDDRGLGQLGAAGRLTRGAGGDLGAGGLLGEGDREGLDGAGGRGGLHGGRVRLDRDDRGALGDTGLGAEGGGERGLRGHRTLVTGLQVGGVGDDARADTDREAGGDLLALGGGRDEHGGRGDGVVRGLERVHLRHDEVVGVLGGVVREDLDRAVLGERGGGVLGTGAEGDRDGLADTAGQRQQFQGGLADGTVHVVDVDENFSHGDALLRIAKSEGR
jgi:hypothetical protein